MEYYDKGVEEIVNSYQFNDVLLAIFCLNSWRQNSNFVSSQITLNLSLMNYKEEDENSSMRSYSDFRKFHSRLKEKAEMNSIMNDPTLSDFGENKLFFEQVGYKSILGNGYEYAYSASFICLDYLKDNSKYITQEILKYQDEMINFLEELNEHSNESVYSNEYSLPTEGYFNQCIKYFKFLYTKDLKKIEKKLKTTNISLMHFIKRGNIIYPLFNSSFNLDSLLRLIEHSPQDRLVSNTIRNLCGKLADTNESVLVKTNPTLLINKSSIPFSCDFMYFTNEGKAVIAYNVDLVDDSTIEHEKETLNRRNKLDGIQLLNPKTRMVTQFEKNYDIEYLLYDSFFNLHLTNFILNDEEHSHYSGVDIVTLLLCVEDLQEVHKVLSHKKQQKEKIMNAFIGLTGEYATLKSMNYVISEGSMDFGLVNVGLDMATTFITKKFDEFGTIPLYNKKNSYNNIHEWTINGERLNWKSIRRKNDNTNGGYFYNSYNNHFFIEYNLDSFKGLSRKQEYGAFFQSLDDILISEISKYLDFFNSKALENKLIIFRFMNATMYFNGPATYINEYNVSARLRKDLNTFIIEYTVDVDNFLETVESYIDRTQENGIFIELIKPLGNILQHSFNSINTEIQKSNRQVKFGGLNQVVIEYHYTAPYYKLKIPIETFKRVRKEYALICDGNSFMPGTYSDKEAIKKIRKLQIALYDNLVKKVKNFNRNYALIYLLNELSYQLHRSNMAKSRLKILSKDIAVENIETFFIQNSQDEQESHESIRNSSYLIDVILSASQFSEHKEINKEDLLNLYAFAHWYVVLQDNTDMAWFNMKFSKITISDMHVIDIEEDEKFDLFNIEVTKRRKKYGYYEIKGNDNDKTHLKKVDDNLYNDLGFNIADLNDVLHFLSLDMIPAKTEQLAENVYTFHKNDLMDLILSNTNEPIEKSKLEKAFEYLTIDNSKLTYLQGEDMETIPLWESEFRSNTILQKPIIKLEDEKYLYSPALTSHIKDKWKYGLMSLVLPNKENLENTWKAIEEWKHDYESILEKETADKFQTLLPAAKVWHSIHFDEIILGKGRDNPIGDTDVFVVDKELKTIWIIEVKFLRRHMSLKEFYKQQIHFFEGNKSEEKFNNRITFFNNNKDLLQKKMGIKNNEYSIETLIIMNKIFIPLYTKYDFIKYICFTEIYDYIYNYKKENSK